MRVARKKRRWAVIMLCGLTLGVASISASAQATTGYKLQGQFSTNEGNDANGVAVNQSTNDVYVAALFPFSHGTLEEFSASGTFIKSLQSAPTEFAPRFSGVAVDPGSQRVYAVDDQNQLIDAFDAEGNPVSSFTGGTSSSLPVTGGRETNVQIASDANGDIYYPNQALEEVQEFWPDGAPGPVTIAGLARPTDVAVAPTRIYIVDTNSSVGGSQVQQFDSSGALVGTGVLGEGVLSKPKAVTVDSSGDVFVIDESTSGIVVAEFDSAGTLIRTFGAGVISSASGIAVDSSSGEVYVLENAGFASHGPVLILGSSSVTVPTALTDPAVGVEPSVETVTGTVNPQGTDTKYFFQYGPSTAYGQSTTEADAGSGRADSAAEVTIPFLEPDQTYHYRLVATNAEGDRVYGADQMFTTQAAPPLIGSERASNITSIDAVLEAQINPNNQATSYYFKYATNPALSGATAVPTPPGPEVGAGFGESPVTQDIGGTLSPNTTYYFQVLATNATNTTEGPIESFTTLPPAPVAATEAPVFVTETTATLNGTLTTQDAQTTYSFQYVADADYKSTGYEHAISVPQPQGEAGASPQPISVTAFVAGLAADTAYHVRLVADNAGGFTEGTEQTFTTVVLPPSLSTGMPVSIAVTEATIDGGVNPEHGETTYRFEYIDEAGFLNSGYRDAIRVPQPVGNAGASGEPQLVTATFTDLEPATIYHYRLVARNAGGTREGADETFSTPAERGSQELQASQFGAGPSLPLPGITYPDMADLAPLPARQHLSAPEPKELSCRAKATRIKNGRRRRAALKKCRRKGRLGKEGLAGPPSGGRSAGT
jgi:hypothetical protein